MKKQNPSDPEVLRWQTSGLPKLNLRVFVLIDSNADPLPAPVLAAATLKKRTGRTLGQKVCFVLRSPKKIGRLLELGNDNSLLQHYDVIAWRYAETKKLRRRRGASETVDERRARLRNLYEASAVTFWKIEAREWRKLFEEQRGGATFNETQRELGKARAEISRLKAENKT